MPVTPNVGLTEPIINSYGWGSPTNGNWSILDAIFGGARAIPALQISGDMRVEGTITAGSFAGLDGAYFLQSSLFNIANGVPQLNSSGKIPTSLIPGLNLITIPFSATPSFNAAVASGFNLTLSGNVTASTFINGPSGGPLITFRIIQDGSGGHPFVWPVNVRNAGVLSLDLNARSIQFFMRDVDGSLDAASPIMYS